MSTQPKYVLPTVEAASAEPALAKLYTGESLTEAEAEALFAELVAGRLAEPAIAAMLVALRLKGETAGEMIGAARALRAADADFPRPDYLFADSCGTGGDGSASINVSTAVAFAAAAAGLPIAKHGNRSVTSRCGSADVLEQLGAKLDASAGGTSSLTPSCSSTSAEPQREVIERLPCLATGRPAAAATKAVAVETLIVPEPSPPVPQLSANR